jgi:hypothetical protein
VTFFERVAQLAKELAPLGRLLRNRLSAMDGVGVGANTRCVEQSCTQLWHRDVTILPDDLAKQGPVRVQLALASRSTLRCSRRAPLPPDRKRPSRSVLAHLAIPSAATLPRDRSDLPRYTAETAPEAPMAKVLT